MNTLSKKSKIIVFSIGAILLILVGVFIGKMSNSSPQGKNHLDESGIEVGKETWTCSMHPNIHKDHAGQCPICGMDLVKIQKSDAGTLYNSGPSLRLSDYAKKLARVQTTRVSKGIQKGYKELSGVVNWDESKLKSETAWFAGRIENLKVNYTGQYVQKGQVLAEIYSPDLYIAAEEWRQAKKSGDPLFIQSVQKKLNLLGLNEEAIEKLANVNSSRVVQKATQSGVVVSKNVEEGQYVKIGSPMVKLGSIENLWVELDVYEQDLVLIQKGQKIIMEADGLNGSKFQARVEFIDPVVNPQSRTIRIRLSVINIKQLLKPGMLVRGQLEIKDKSKGLYIPETAPLITGKQSIVYVENSDGMYEYRQVQLGSLRNGFYEVLKGLEEGEIVVKRGAFKIDAAMQIQALPSMMYPQGGVSTMMHNHGDKDSNKPESKRVNNSGWLNKFYNHYLSLQSSLSTDNMKDASAALSELVQMLKSIPVNLKDEHSKHRLMAIEKSIQSQKIENFRTEMISISELLISWMKTSSFKPSQGASVYFCPMSNNNQGAKWLQIGGDVKNPFYGASMQSCGEKVETISIGVAQ